MIANSPEFYKVYWDVQKLQTIYEKITADPRYTEGVKYGKPRTGHAEGTVELHIIDLENNLMMLHPLLSEVEYWKLRILVHTHDTMKLWAKRDSPIAGNESHATLAKRFLAEFLDETLVEPAQRNDLLNMVQYHDENWAIWKGFEEKGRVKQSRLNNVLSIKDMDVFLFFTIIDAYTPSKEYKKLRWFVDIVNEHRPVPRVYKALERFGL
jgi:hypothetical protein